MTSHLNAITSPDQTPIDDLVAEAYGPFASMSDVQTMLFVWFAASQLLDEAGLVNDDGSVRPTMMTPEDLVTRPTGEARWVKLTLSSLCTFDASVQALLAAAAEQTEADVATRVRKAALTPLHYKNDQAGILPIHPAIVRAALARA